MMPSCFLFCRMKIRQKQHFFRQRQQKSIFGPVFKQKFSDQKSTQNVSKHVVLCSYVSINFLRALYDLHIQPLISSFLSYNFEKMA